MTASRLPSADPASVRAGGRKKYPGDSSARVRRRESYVKRTLEFSYYFTFMVILILDY